MSSSYDVICLSHDPGIRVTGDLDAVSVDRNGDLPQTLTQVREEHPHCDLAVTRESGAVVAVGCIDPGDHGHASPHWVDMDVLRLIHQARRVADANGVSPTGVQQARDQNGLVQALDRCFAARQCWPHVRIERLRRVVELEPWSS